MITIFVMCYNWMHPTITNFMCLFVDLFVDENTHKWYFYLRYFTPKKGHQIISKLTMYKFTRFIVKDSYGMFKKTFWELKESSNQHVIYFIMGAIGIFKLKGWHTSSKRKLTLTLSLKLKSIMSSHFVTKQFVMSSHFEN